MTWDEIHSWGREMIQLINVIVMQARWTEFMYLEPCENMDVIVYVSNTSTPEVNWEEEAGKTPPNWRARQLKQWSDGDSWRSPFVFQSFCGENMWLYGHRTIFFKKVTRRHYFHSIFRYLHPEGLPSDYTMSFLFRILPDTPQEPFALWEILKKNSDPLVGIILDSKYIYGCHICYIHYDACGMPSCHLMLQHNLYNV